MKLTDEVYLVGGGNLGFGLSGDLDCHVYAIDGGSEIALVDAGLGGAAPVDAILGNLVADGLDLSLVRHLLLTHYHSDHAGGAAELVERLGVAVYASWDAAPAIRSADEDLIGLNIAKAAGIYPEGYHFQPCQVKQELAEDDRVQVGDLAVTVVETPGHCAGHLSFLLDGKQKRYFLGGDLVFFGGQVLLSNIPDCSIQDYAQSMLKLEGQAIDVFLPGHQSISLSQGQRHIDAANAAFRKLAVPRNLAI